MAILSNTYVTVDAILTKKGRELLARNDGSFKITQFALSDDEIDYTLYNTSHPSGSAFYGEAIENTPIMEAFPDESQLMKYKLVTLPRGTNKLPVVSLGYSTISLNQGASITITPQTLNFLASNTSFEPNGYIASVSDKRLFSIFQGSGIEISENEDVSNVSVGTKLSKSDIGTSFNLTATTINSLFGSLSSLTTTLTIVGRDSGARITIPITLTKTNN